MRTDTNHLGLIRHTQELSSIIQDYIRRNDDAIMALQQADKAYNVVYNGGARGNGTTNDWGAFSQALASGAKHIIVPYPTSSYYLSGAVLDIPAGVTIHGLGYRPQIKADSSLATDLFRFNAVTGAGMKNLTLNGNYSATSATALIYCAAGTTKIALEGIDCLNAKGYGIYSGGLTNSTLRDIKAVSGQNSGIEFAESGTSGNIIDGFYANANAGMGIRAANGAHHNKFLNLSCTSNTLELLGMTYECYSNIIANVHAQGTGDNGVSITGYNNSLSNITTHNNNNNGLSIYGHNNRATNITAYNNNQSASGFCGITLSGGFGGRSDNNILSNLHTYDDQGSPTQVHGLVMGANNYTNWSAGAAKGARATVYYLNNVYFTSAGGTTGVTAPTHTAGSVSDGGVTWLFLYTTATSHHATGNRISGQYGYGNTGALLQNDAPSGTNYSADYTAIP